MSDTKPGSELATIQQGMGKDIDAYFRDPGMQARHLELLEADAGEGVARPARSVGRKAAIERRMREDDAEYWKSPALQAEYQQLLEREEGGDDGVGGDVLPTPTDDPKWSAALRVVQEVRSAAGDEWQAL